AEYLPGYVAALCAALVWSLYSVLNRRNAQVPATALIAACGAVSIAAAAVHLTLETTVLPTTPQLVALLAMGLGPTGAAFLLWDSGTKHGDLALLGILSYAAPVLSTLSLLLFGLSAAHWTQGAAVLLVLAGVVLGRAPART
ncbi:MAG: EamA family transporter, partial [Pseudomonadota bacterium]